MPLTNLRFPSSQVKGVPVKGLMASQWSGFMAEGGLRGTLEGPNVRWGRQNGTFRPCNGTLESLRGALG